MITKDIIEKNGSNVARTCLTIPQISPLNRVLPEVSPVHDLLEITRAFNFVDRRYEVASVAALAIISASVVCMCLNYASVWQF
jgi:hypothetical protein